MKSIAAIAAIAGAAAAASAGSTVDIMIDIDTFDALGAPGNIVESFDLNAAAGFGSGNQVVVTGIGWDLIVEAFDPSWLSEARLNFGDADNYVLADSLTLTPSGTTAPGIEPSSSPVQVFADLALPNIVLSQGNLRVEGFESFVDALAPNGNISGTLTIQATFVPAPGAAALLGMGGLVATRRRRA